MLDQVASPQRRKAASGSSLADHSEEFPRARLARMHAILQRHVSRGIVPGLVAGLYHRGRRHIHTLGAMAFDSGTPMRRDAIFRLASTTKPITAAAAMILVEECRIRLDDPVDEWLPELKQRRVLRTIRSTLDDTVPAKRAITLRDLLTFRSGYGEVALLDGGEGGPELEQLYLSQPSPFQAALSEAGLSLNEWPFAGTSDEFMERLGRLPLAHQPGERWLYHTSAEILGVLIARVSGMSLGRFLEERIFAPLGMTDTAFQVPAEKLHRLPACYGRDMMNGKLIVLHPAGCGYARRPDAFESGAGGLVSTVDDLLAFGRMMLVDGGGERLLSRPAIELMTRDHLTPEQKAVSPFFQGFWESRGWGLGLGVVTARKDIGEVPGRFGWDGAFGTSWYVDPNEDLIGVLMIQRRPDRLALPPVTFDFWTAVYQLIED